MKFKKLNTVRDYLSRNWQISLANSFVLRSCFQLKARIRLPFLNKQLAKQNMNCQLGA
jgi:hypothetical protein